MVDHVGGKPNDTLSSLHHTIFTKKVANAKAFVTHEKLPPPPIFPATGFHKARGYFQIMLWMVLGMKWTYLMAMEAENQSIPMMTEKHAAPDELLKVIDCNCWIGCKSSRCCWCRSLSPKHRCTHQDHQVWVDTYSRVAIQSFRTCPSLTSS